MAAYGRLFRLGAGHSGYQLQYSIDKGRELKDAGFFAVNKTFLPAKAFYFLFCGSMVSLVPFVPVYMEQLGLNSFQVGIIKAVPPIGTLVACPLWGAVTDAYGIHKSSILAGIGIGGVALGATYFTPSSQSASANATESTTMPPLDDWGDSTTTFIIMISLMMLSMTFTAHVMPIVNYAVMRLVDTHPGTDYGKQRLWGAAGWGTISGITGLLMDTYGRFYPDENRFLPAYVIFASLMLPAVIPILCMRFPPHTRPTSISRGILGMLANLDILIFLFICAVAGMSLGVISTFQFIFLQSLEAPNVVMGLTLTFTCLSEIPFMYVSGRIIRWIGEEAVFVIALLCYALRFVLYSLLENPWLILPIELLHGICFGALYPVMTSYAHRISPPGMESTVQNIMSAASKGVGSAVGTIAGGYVYDRCGPRRLFLYCSIICGASSVFFVVYTALTRLLTRYRRHLVTYDEL